MIELINVCKKYVTKAGDTQALNNVSIKFADKGLVFILGKSGCGKTTLLNMIGGLDSIDSGEIIIDGKKFSEFSPKDYDSYRNTLVGFVFQEYNLLSDYNIGKNINIANELQGSNAKEEDIAKLLTTVEIGGYENRKPYQLSGGQKQRASIARALIKNPKIVLADEPTGALDSATGVQVMELLKELSKEKLIVVVSHEADFAEKYADRIIRLVDGRVVEDITQKDVEMTQVVHEFEDELVVKAGADLSDEDTKKLTKAIKENKKINITEKSYFKERKNTEKEEYSEQTQKESIKFIQSKMKLKSVAGLGLKSLVAKPIRLIFTVLLSIIAFAMFGVFDAVASFNDERGLIALLKGDNYNSVSIYAEYNNYGYENVNFKLSQAQINKLNKETKYSFRGIYDIRDQEEYAEYLNERSNFNEEHIISDPSVVGNLTTGGDYYIKHVSGMVEFKESEIVNKVILPKEYNYKIIYGDYPTLKKSNEMYQGVGISSYVAKSIITYMRLNRKEVFGGKKGIKDIGDLVGANIGLGNLNTKYFTIKAIIDCGDIPEKYSKLKESTTGTMTALTEDFTTYINTGCYLTLFLPDGYVQNRRDEYNRKTAYFADYGNREFSITQSGLDVPLTKSIKPYFYNTVEFNEENTILFGDVENGNASQGTPQLNADEVLISVNNLRLLFDIEHDKCNGALQAQFRGLTDGLIAEQDLDTRISKTRQLLELMKSIYNDQYYKYESNQYRKVLQFNEINDGQEIEPKLLKVKGFYFDTNKDMITTITNVSYYEPFVFSNEGLKALSISTNQGFYSRAISGLKDNSRGATLLGEMMVEDDGFCLRWYKNSMVDTLKANSGFLNQLLQLFLYISLIIIVFSMFMLMNYITTSIASKRHAIGILRALGAKGSNIFVMFLFESIIIALINGIFASVVGYIASIFVNAYILDVMNMTISFALFGLRQVLIIVGVSVATGFVSSLIPIRKIIKEKPVALIRKES